MTHRTRRIKLTVTLALLVVIAVGCKSNPKPPERQWLHISPYPQPRTVAITVFLNQSGSDAIDPVAMTDEFYTELQQIPGLEVIPVNQVLAAMEQMGMGQLGTPEDAIQLANTVNADMVIVGAVTRHDPYWPPIVGLVVQLYARPDTAQLDETPTAVHPKELAQASQPFELAMAPPMKPQAMVVRIYDAGQKEVQNRLEKYAKKSGKPTPFGWKKYTTRRAYLRFVAHEIIGEMLAQESVRLHPDQRGEK